MPGETSTQQTKTGFGRRWCDVCSVVHHYKSKPTKLCGKRGREGDASTTAFCDLRRAIC